VQGYIQKHGQEPNVISLTLDDEAELAALTAADVGDLAQEIWIKGPRAALSTLFGMELRWGAEEFGVVYEAPVDVAALFQRPSQNPAEKMQELHDSLIRDFEQIQASKPKTL